MSECHSIYLFSHPSVFSSSLALTIDLPNVYCSWEKGQPWVTVDSPGIFMVQCKKILPCHFPLGIDIDTRVRVLSELLQLFALVSS